MKRTLTKGERLVAEMCGDMIMTCYTSGTALMSLLPAPTENGSLLCGNGDGVFFFTVTVL